MIIDALTHIHPDPKAFGAKHDASAGHLFEALSRSSVDRAVVTAIASDTNYGTPTEFVAQYAQQFPDEIIAFASVHPKTDPDPCGRLKRYVEELGCKGLKIHPRNQGISPADPAVVGVVATAASLNIPVMVCGSQWKHAPLEVQQPMNVDVLAKAVPEANIIVAHSGGFKFMDAFIVAVANDNVFLETSVALTYFHGTPFEEQYLFCLRKLGAHRIVYGSDHPDYPLDECYYDSRAILEGAGFGAADLDQIFGGTIAKLLNLA